jgi:hypothetical protein
MKLLLASLLVATSAHAELVATVDTNGGRIEVHNTDGACVEGARHALYVGKEGKRVAGCWVHATGGLFFVFFDGDIARVPMGALKTPEGV